MKPDNVLRTSVCKAVGKILEVTSELQELDQIRFLCKNQQGKQVIPVMLERHKALLDTSVS